MKFGRVVGDTEAPFTYPHVWVRLDYSNGSISLVIAPSEKHIDTLLELTECLSEPFKILYVLVVPRGEGEPGRYESPVLTRAEMVNFMRRFEGFFEGDGRAHVWVASVDPPADPEGTLVYDRHNLIYAYGPLVPYEVVLSARGLSQSAEVDIPAPHSHHYNVELDGEAQRILDYWDWTWQPLRPGDKV